MEKLDDYHLERIGGELSVKGLKMVSVVYGMGIKQNELEDIESSGRDDESAKKRSILIKWRNRTGAQKEVRERGNIERLRLQSHTSDLRVRLSAHLHYEIVKCVGHISMYLLYYVFALVCIHNSTYLQICMKKKQICTKIVEKLNVHLLTRKNCEIVHLWKRNYCELVHLCIFPTLCKFCFFFALFHAYLQICTNANM